MLEEIALTPVGDLKARTPARARPETTLFEVVARMREARRGAALIEDHEQRLVGIFTERDLMLRVDHGDPSWPDRPVSEVMTRYPVTIPATASLARALRQMRKGPFRHLPVMDGQGRARGILSIRDILAYMAEHFPAEFLNLPPDPEHEANERWGG